MTDQTNIAELERRITSALARIGAGLDKLWQGDGAPVVVAPVSAPPPTNTAALEAEIARLKTTLAAEKATVAQLTERLKTSPPREPEPRDAVPRDTAPPPQTDARMEKMTQQLDIQGLELQRMRKSTVQLREQLRVLHEAAAANLVEPQTINKAMLAELESLRATRHTEIAEMDEILAELKPLIEEARAHG
jgi:uncharacterized protein involved in exopolysaccharide biosynthesis